MSLHVAAAGNPRRRGDRASEALRADRLPRPEHRPPAAQSRRAGLLQRLRDAYARSPVPAPRSRGAGAPARPVLRRLLRPWPGSRRPYVRGAPAGGDRRPEPEREPRGRRRPVGALSHRRGGADAASPLLSAVSGDGHAGRVRQRDAQQSAFRGTGRHPRRRGATHRRSARGQVQGRDVRDPGRRRARRRLCHLARAQRAGHGAYRRAAARTARRAAPKAAAGREARPGDARGRAAASVRRGRRGALCSTSSSASTPASPSRFSPRSGRRSRTPPGGSGSTSSAATCRRVLPRFCRASSRTWAS